MTCAGRLCQGCGQEASWTGRGNLCPACKAAPAAPAVRVHSLSREALAEVKAAAKGLLEKGLSLAAVMHRTGVHWETLRKWRARDDWSVPERPTPRKRWSPGMPRAGSKLPWAQRLRERVGPGVCLYCRVTLVQPKAGRHREVCPEPECQVEWRRDYDSAGAYSATPDWVLEAIGELRAGRQALAFGLSTLKASLAEHLREA